MAKDPNAPKKLQIPCAISGRDRPRKDLISIDMIRPALADRMRVDHPGLATDALISRSELARYRTVYVLSLIHI